MGAMINLNGVALGNATNQFIRYVFEVTVDDGGGGGASPPSPAARLHAPGSGSANTLTVTFGASLGIDTGLRFTHSTEIDWAPPMGTRECTTPAPGEAAKDACLSTFGFGIWKSVYLVPVGSAADPQKAAGVITQLVPHTYYAGGHPTAILADDDHDGFEVRVRVELLATAAGSGAVTVQGSWPGAAPVTQEVTFVEGVNTASLIIPASETVGVKLWHIHGHGGQPMYNITATTVFANGLPPHHTATTTRRMAFRHIALVTINDTDTATRNRASNESGTGTLTMFFRVNGAAVYVRQLRHHLDHFPRTSQLYSTLHMPCYMFYFVPMLIGGGLVIGIRCCDQIGALGPRREQGPHGSARRPAVCAGHPAAGPKRGRGEHEHASDLGWWHLGEPGLLRCLR